MTELIGDVCQPSELTIPLKSTAELDTISGQLILHVSGLVATSGLIFLNESTGKLEFWDGTLFQSITSTDAR